MTSTRHFLISFLWFPLCNCWNFHDAHVAAVESLSLHWLFDCACKTKVSRPSTHGFSSMKLHLCGKVVQIHPCQSFVFRVEHRHKKNHFLSTNNLEKRVISLPWIEVLSRWTWYFLFTSRRVCGSQTPSWLTFPIFVKQRQIGDWDL